MLSSALLPLLANADRAIWLLTENINGNYNNLAELDALCADSLANGDFTGTTAVDSAGLQAFAMVSTLDLPACVRTPDEVYVLNDGSQTVVANDHTDLWDGTLNVGITHDQDQQSFTNVIVWTGTTQDGFTFADRHCRSWTSTDGGQFGRAGINSVAASPWVSAFDSNCDNDYGFYCISGEPGDIMSHITGDPHLTGFDGSKFDFTGESGKVFNFISEPFLQVNARFIALQIGTVNGTWTSEVGIKYMDNDVVVSPGLVNVNGRVIDTGDVEVELSSAGSVSISKNGKTVTVYTNTYSIRITTVEEVEGTYLNTFFSLVQKPVNPHGVIGQTARYTLTGESPKPIVSKAHNGEDILEGEVDDYLVRDGILGASFTYNRFTGASDSLEQRKRSDMETLHASFA